MSAELRARLELAAAAALFSTGGAAVKACSLTSFQVASFRSAVACLAALAVFRESRRRWSRRSFAVGFAYAGTMVLFIVANKLTTAANAIFLQYSAPLYVLLAAPWLLNEPLRPRDLLYFAVVAGGLCLLFLDGGAPLASAPRPALGNAIALVSGVFWAATALGLRWMARPGSGGAPVETAMVCGNLIAFLGCLPAALPVASPRVADGLLILYLGGFQITAAYYFLMRGLRQVPALESSLLLLLEPVLNPVWAWLVHGERPGPWAITGGAVILMATAVKTWKDARTQAPSAAVP